MIENIKSEIARELNNPRSPWTPAELFARLIFVEEYERHVQFLVSLDNVDNHVFPDWLEH